MGLLERSDEIAQLTERLADVRRDASGRVVFVGAEAGGGKSALVRTFTDRLQRAPVLVGACEPLFTPRPLGPWIDIAVEAGGVAAATVAESPTPADLLDAVARMVREPTVVVLEDLHWADEASLDVLRLLIRRIGRIKALVIACRFAASRVVRSRRCSTVTLASPPTSTRAPAATRSTSPS
jgi:predicted ATPase